MTTLSIKLPESLAKRITRAAASEGISRSESLRKAALDRLKPKKGAQKLRPSAYELTADLVGSEKSGVPDLATNPRFMKEFGG